MWHPRSTRNPLRAAATGMAGALVVGLTAIAPTAPTAAAEPACATDERVVTNVTVGSAARLVTWSATGAGETPVDVDGLIPLRVAQSPDRAWIAFTAVDDRGSGATGQAELFVTPADGSAAPTRLSEHGATGATVGQPVWSPDSSRLAASIATPADLGQIVVFDPSGVATPVTVSGDVAAATDPTWSSDGSRIAFGRSLAGVTGAYSAPSDGSAAPTPLAGDLVGARTAWSLNSDGTSGVVVADGLAHLAATDAGTPSEPLTTGDPEAPLTGTARVTWSPDGTTVAVAVVDGTTATLYAGDPTLPLAPLDTTTAEEASDPSWSADAAQLAWIAGAEVRALPADGSTTAVVVGTGADARHRPTWSVDADTVGWLAEAGTDPFPETVVIGPVDATTAPAVISEPDRPSKTEIAFAATGDVLGVSAPATGAVLAEETVSFETDGSDRRVLGANSLIDPVLSPDGLSVALVTGATVRIVPIQGGATLTLGGPADGSAVVAWSPDSTRVAVQSMPGAALVVYDLTAGATATEIAPTADVRELSWSPDGSRLAWIAPGDDPPVIVAGPAGDPDPTGLRSYTDGEPTQLRWSADGSRLATVITPDAAGPAAVEVLDPGTGAVVDSGASGTGGAQIAWEPAGSRLAVASLDVTTSGAFDGSWTARLEVWETADGGRVDLGEGRAPAWSPDGTLLAYDTRATVVSGGLLTVSAGEVEVVDPSDPPSAVSFGSEAYLVDDDPSIGVRSVDANPRWSADGTELAWVRTFRTDPAVSALGIFTLLNQPGFADVVTAPADAGSSPTRRMTSSGFGQADWSPVTASLLSYERTTAPGGSPTRFAGADRVSSPPQWALLGCLADLSVAIDGLSDGDRLSASSTGAAQIVVTNDGPGTSAPATVTVQWPTRLGVSAPSPDVGTFAGSATGGTWSVPALAPGGTATLTLPFEVGVDAGDAGGTVGSVTAILVGGGPDPDATDRTASVTISLQGTSGYNPVTPTRILDTRKGVGAPEAPLGPGGVVTIDVGGLGGVPDEGVTAVVLNLTGTSPSAATHLTVHPADTPRPTASNLNLATNQTAANLVVAPVAADGSIRIVNNAGTTHAIADAVGWFDDGYAGGFGLEPTTPVRVLDTRKGEGAPLAKVGAGETLVIRPPQLFDAGTGEATAAAAVLTLTAVGPSASTHISAWGEGARPTVSSLNLPLGATRSNLVVVPVGADGSIRLFNNSGEVDLVADLAGSFPVDGSGLPFHPVDPVRLLDTRSGLGTTGGAFGPREQRDLAVASRPEVGDDARVAILNFTAVAPLSDTHLRVWPAGTTRPLTAVLNAPVAQTTPSLAFSTLGSGSAGAVSLYNNSGRAHYLADLSGWFG